MTVNERKMTIAYADLLNIQELAQHILKIDVDDLLNPETRKEFAQIVIQLDMVMANVRSYVSSRTDLSKETSNGRT